MALSITTTSLLQVLIQFNYISSFTIQLNVFLVKKYLMQFCSLNQNLLLHLRLLSIFLSGPGFIYRVHANALQSLETCVVSSSFAHKIISVTNIRNFSNGCKELSKWRCFIIL